MKPSTTRDETYRQGETAILFVDMQKLFCTPGGDPQHPELDAKHFFHRQLAATVIPNQVRLLNKCFENCERNFRITLTLLYFKSVNRTDGAIWWHF